MTSTNFCIGMGDGRNSSKVLKPPGGGSSNIFGQMTNGEKAAPVKTNQTKDRLFGTAEPEPATPSKSNKMKSAIFSNEGHTSPKQNKKKFAIVRHNPITGEVIEIDYEKNGENKEEVEERPEVEQNGDVKDTVQPEVKATSLPEMKAPAPLEMKASAPPEIKVPTQPEPVKNLKPTSVRVRQPPGGKSSGIF